MTRNGVPIADHPLKKEVKGVDPGIEFELLFGQAEAIVAAGLNLHDFWNGVYSNRFIGFVMAWHKNHNLVGLHVQDANTKRKASSSKAGGAKLKRPRRRR